MAKVTIPNYKFAALLQAQGLYTEYEVKVRKARSDIHIFDTNIIVEINPTCTHNSTKKIGLFDPVPYWYHMRRTQMAMQKHLRLVHVWDWNTYQERIDLIKWLIKTGTDVPCKCKPRCHLYNMKTKEHLIAYDQITIKEHIAMGFVEVYDAGQDIDGED